MKGIKSHLKVLAEKVREFLRPPAQIVRSRPVNDAQLLSAMAVDADHPMFQAFMELIERSRQDARTNAKNVIANDRETVFALGAEYGLDALQEYMLNLRAEGLAHLKKVEAAMEEAGE